MYATYRAECVDTWLPTHVAEWLQQIGVRDEQREAVDTWLKDSSSSGVVDGKALLALPLKTEHNISVDLDRVTRRNLFANLKHLKSQFALVRSQYARLGGAPKSDYPQLQSVWKNFRTQMRSGSAAGSSGDVAEQGVSEQKN